MHMYVVPPQQISTSTSSQLTLTNEGVLGSILICALGDEFEMTLS